MKRLLPLVLLAASASAQISTDRPGLAFSPSVVDRGVFQVEAGLPQATQVDVENAMPSQYSFPVQLRYGLTDAVELRLSTSVYDVRRVSTGGQGSDLDGDVGFGVIELGSKVQLATNGPRVAVLTSVSVPTQESSGLGVAARALAGWTLSNRLGLTTVLGASVADSDPDATVTGEAVALVSAALSEAASVYAEAAAFPGENATPVFAGAGALLRVTPDVQLDVSFDAGLNNDAPDLLFGFGASVRF